MLDLIRGAVRPIVLLIAVLSSIAFIWFAKVVPEWWPALLGTMITYYFMRRQDANSK